MKRRMVVLGALGIGAVATAGWLVSMPSAQAGPIYSGRDDGVAIKGADAVAYFTLGEAAQGIPAHSVSWNGSTWLFANAEHKALFEAAPERYAPQYGGFCAYAAANGQKAKIEPEAWSIVDGKLYLNYDLGIKGRWDAKRTDYIAAADREWPKIAAD